MTFVIFPRRGFLVIVITSRVVEMGEKGEMMRICIREKRVFFPHVTTLSSNRE
jgi:hypothetical protein